MRQPIEATAQVFGEGADWRLGTSLAVCPSRSLVVGAPGALLQARVWRTMPGQAQSGTPTIIPVDPALSPGVSVSCGSAFQVGAPGPDGVPGAPCAIYFSSTTGKYDGGAGTRMGNAMATLAPLADGGPERFVVGAPGGTTGAVLLWTNAPNPTVSPLVPVGNLFALGTSVVVGDFDGDGLQDIAVGATAQVLIYLQQSSGAFAQSPLNLVPVGFAGKLSLGRALAVSPAAFNQRAQLAVGVPEDNSVYLVALAPDGGATFSPTLVGADSGTALFGTAVAMGDWDQDGVVELFASAPGDGAGRVTRWVLDGGWRRLAGDFVPPAGLNPGASYGRALAVGDIGGPNAGPELIVGAPNFQNTLPGEGAYFVYAFDGGVDAGSGTGGCVTSAECSPWCGAPQDCVNLVCVPRAPACGAGLTCVQDAVLGGICVLPDGGSGDAGAPDAGVRDAGVRDAGASDAGASDSGVPDAGVADAGARDAGGADAGTADAGASDAGAAGAADGGVQQLRYQACGCSSAGPLPGLLAVLAHLAWRRRRLAA